jgi:uncharacterized DUF497 family protein
VKFVWDEGKRESNLAKHGLDFAHVEKSFDFATAIITTARTPRRKAIGRLGRIIVVLIFAPLGTEAISLIRLRAASKKERAERIAQSAAS